LEVKVFGEVTLKGKVIVGSGTSLSAIPALGFPLIGPDAAAKNLTVLKEFPENDIPPFETCISVGIPVDLTSKVLSGNPVNGVWYQK
jgi:hypothetical protein